MFHGELNNFTTHLTKNIEMRSPFIFYPKNDVSNQCINMALNGGIGIIHSNFPTPADQAAEVFKVKHHKQGSIPRCIGINDSVFDLFTNESEGDFRAAFVTSNGKVGGKLLGSF